MSVSAEEAARLRRLHTEVLAKSRAETAYEIGKGWEAFARGKPLDDNWRANPEYEQLLKERSEAQKALYRAIDELEGT